MDLPLDWLRQRTRVTPNTTALIIGDEQWTYAELDRLTDDICHQLQTAGVDSGQLVAVLMPAELTYVCIVHGLARMGAVLVPLNTRLTLAELGWQLNLTQAPMLLYDESEQERAMRLKKESHGPLKILNCQMSIVNSNSPPSDFKFSMSNLQSIVFTSGTTGHPKGVMLTFGNHFWSANASAYRLGVFPNDRWISCLPLYHVGGLAVLFRSCLYGTAVILHQKFDPAAINHSLDAQAGTLISLVPTMLYRLLQTRDHWPESLRLILLGGAPAAPELIRQADNLKRKGSKGNPEHHLPVVATTYGLTEAASQVATQTPAQTAVKPGSVGKPLMFSNVRIAAENGRSLPPGEIGELVVSGPTLMKGYFKNEVATEKTIKGGELYTGDMGYIDEDGDIWLVQRRSDIIVTGGENVYPAEVEKVYRTHPAITAVCVVGVPDPEWGQAVAAMLVLEKPGAVNAADLIKFGRQQLAGYKVPRLIHIASALPLTASGKIHRQAVQDLLSSN